MDNTRTSIFVLSNRNVLHHVFLEKNNSSHLSGTTGEDDEDILESRELLEECVFRSSGVIRFHPKNILFTFRAVSIPAEMEATILAKNASRALVSIPESFIPNEHNGAKFIVYALLVQDNDNLKIFTSNLANHVNITPKVYDASALEELHIIQAKREAEKREVQRKKDEAVRAEHEKLEFEKQQELLRLEKTRL